MTMLRQFLTEAIAAKRELMRDSPMLAGFLALWIVLIGISLVSRCSA